MPMNYKWPVNKYRREKLNVNQFGKCVKNFEEKFLDFKLNNFSTYRDIKLSPLNQA